MKTLFVINPHSIIDVITNSSSELYVFKGKNKETIEKMIEEIYPNYLREYEPIVNITELSSGELNNFIWYHTQPDGWPSNREDYNLIGDYTFDELYEPVNRFGRIEYRLKDNRFKKTKIKKFNDFKKNDLDDPWGEESNDNIDVIDQYELRDWMRKFVTDDNIQEVINRIDPDHEMYFMYSIGENPDWEEQEKLMKIGDRYHLG